MNACISQVKENRSAAVRLSLLLSGITVSLAEKYKDGADVNRQVRMFRNNTVPYIIGLIDECSGLRIVQRNNAKLLYDRLQEGERELKECIDVLDVVLPEPCTDGLTKFKAEQEGQISSQEPRTFAAAVGSSFSRILGLVTTAGDRVFKSPADKREVIDLVFMCDVTGGMANSGCMDKVKDRIEEVARSTRTILEERAGLLRVGMVAYRDLWGGEEPMLEIEELTPCVGRVMSHVRRLVPTGGLDVAENVLGGLEAVVNMQSWEDYNKKVLVHFADAPCHGSEYHNLQPKDDLLHDMSKYQEKCGTNSLQKAIKRLAQDKVKYIFVKMNNSTDKMISKFREMAKKEDFLTEVLMADSTLTAKIVQTMDIDRTNLVPFCDATNVWPANSTSRGYPMADVAADAPNPASTGAHCACQREHHLSR
ncbi:unnamed protein product [Ectocarpus sp. CCAP 1310/34]|nr:unnamed protein product [Ectocarpus sp. CCAP 1310/34]